MKQALVSTVVAALLALAGPLACSFSNSSASSADSSGSSAKSSGSSSGKQGNAAFQQDVEQYTTLYVEEGSRDETTFLAGIGALARERGISDWEAEAATWEAIGRALGRAPLSETQRNAYAQAWTGGEADHVRALARGTAAAR